MTEESEQMVEAPLSAIVQFYGIKRRHPGTRMSQYHTVMKRAEEMGYVELQAWIAENMPEEGSEEPHPIALAAKNGFMCTMGPVYMNNQQWGERCAWLYPRGQR